MKNSLILKSYLIVILLFLSCGTVRFLYDKFTMPPQQTFSVNDLELVNLVYDENNRLISTSPDPQLILFNWGNFKIRTVGYKITNGGKGEKALYYAEIDQMEFSGKKCVLPNIENEEVIYILPLKDYRQIRLDISGIDAQEQGITEIYINRQASFLYYINLTAENILMLLVIPLIIVAGIKYIMEIYNHYIKKCDNI